MVEVLEGPDVPVMPYQSERYMGNYQYVNRELLRGRFILQISTKCISMKCRRSTKNNDEDKSSKPLVTHYFGGGVLDDKEPLDISEH